MSLDLTGFDTEEQLREGEFNPPAPGIYHLAISAVDAAPVSKAGEALDGIKVSFQVLAGTVEGMQGREFQSLFFYPNANSRDGGKFASKRLAMLGLATEVIDRSQLGKTVDPNWEDMLAKHLVAEVELRKSNDDKVFPDLKGLHIWHVNHPDAASYPKDAETLNLMPMTWQPEAPPKQEQAAQPAAAAKPATAAAAKPKPGAKRTTTPAPTQAAGAPAGAAAAPAGAAADPYAGL